MLGANIGTALIVKALSFDVSWVAPLLLIAGYVAFRRGRRGRLHDLGRAGIGLGLMLLALHQLVITVQPIQTAPVLGTLRDQGIAILLSEQNARISLRVADRGVVVENGRVALSGSAAELLASSAIAARYLGVEGGSVGRVDERLGARLAAEIRAAQPAGGRERHDTQAGNPHPLHASPAPVPSP